MHYATQQHLLPYEAGGAAGGVDGADDEGAFSVKGPPELMRSFIVCGVMVTVEPEEACIGPDGTDIGSAGCVDGAGPSDCTVTSVSG
jgi:hypothetical protein